MEDIESISCQIIAHAGNAKASIYEALKKAKQNDFAEVDKLLSSAEEEILISHKEHLKLLSMQKEFKNVTEQLLVMHAMDTLMTSMSEMNLIKELIEFMKQEQKGG